VVRGRRDEEEKDRKEKRKRRNKNKRKTKSWKKFSKIKQFVYVIIKKHAFKFIAIKKCDISKKL